MLAKSVKKNYMTLMTNVDDVELEDNSSPLFD